MRNSPFSNKKSRNDKSWDNLRRRFLSKCEEIFLNLFPHLRDMKSGFIAPAGLTIVALLAIIFVLIFTSGYNTTRNTKFLTPVSQIRDSENCETVSLSNTGQFMATQGGLWEGSVGFQYSSAAFILSCTNFVTTAEVYASLMWEVYSELQYVGQQLSINNLGINLIYWMTVAFTADVGNVQRIDMVGDPTTVFDREYTVGMISSISGDCNATAFSSFDGLGKLLLSYNYEEYVANPICNASAQPFMLGYVSGTNANQISVKLDVRTLVTVMAINLGILDFDLLVEIPGYSTNYTYAGMPYNISRFYNPKYPGMTEISCITNVNLNKCVVSTGSMYAIPLFNHMGQSGVLPQPCVCSTISAADLNYQYFPCNMFYLMSGLMFWPQATYSPNGAFEMLLKYNSNVQLINELSYNASFSASFWGQQSPYRDQLDDSITRQQNYQFCNISFGTCSILTFSSFDSYIDNFAISNKYFQLKYGACRDTISTTKEAWMALIETPFAPLDQPYEQCTFDAETAFQTQTGVSVANTAILAPIVALLVANVAVLIMHMWSGTERTSSKTVPSATASQLRVIDTAAVDNKSPARTLLSNNVKSSALIDAESIENNREAATTGESSTNNSYTDTGSSSRAVDNPLFAAGNTVDRSAPPSLRPDHHSDCDAIDGEVYTFNERKRALDALAIVLLRIRDRMDAATVSSVDATPDEQLERALPELQPRHFSVITQLAVELTSIAHKECT